MAKIVTGHTGQNHVTSDDAASFNAGIVGNDSYAFGTPAATFSGNTVTIPKMEIVMQGVHCRTDGTETVVIVATGHGSYRKDLIVGRYSREGGVEQFEIALKQGTAASSAASSKAPTAAAGDMRAGASSAECALFEVLVSGSTIQSVTKSIPTVRGLSFLTQYVSSLISDNVLIRGMVDDANMRSKNNKSLLDKMAFLSFSGNIKSAIRTLTSGTKSVFAIGLSRDSGKGILENEIRIRSDGSISRVYGNTESEIPHIQWGNVKMSSNPAGTTKKQVIYFPVAFKKAPAVIVTPVTSEPGNVSVSVIDVSNLMFTLCFTRNSSIETSVRWVAIGSMEG